MPGESASVMARHVVTQGDVDAGEVINQARVSGDDPGGNRTPEFLSDDPNTPEPGDETITPRSEEHTSELQSLMRISYAVLFLKNKNTDIIRNYRHSQEH